MGLRAAVFVLVVLLGATMPGVRSFAESCTTQSQMKDAERDTLAAAARDIAARVQANDAAGLKAQTVAELAGNFGAMQGLLTDVAPHLKGGALTVDQVYLLDASQMKVGSDAQFFCTLNKSASDAEFLIPGVDSGGLRVRDRERRVFACTMGGPDAAAARTREVAVSGHLSPSDGGSRPRWNLVLARGPAPGCGEAAMERVGVLQRSRGAVAAGRICCFDTSREVTR